MPIDHFRGLFLAGDVGPNRTRFPIMAAIKLDDEVLYVWRFWTGIGEPQCQVYRGMEGTVAAPHEAGTEIEYITPTLDPAFAAQFARYGRLVQRRNGKYPHSWEDPARQDWPEMNPD
jgi:hypothetical protein